MIVLSRSLPDVEDIEISAKMNAWELTGEQIVMQKYPKMNNAIETADTHKIKETFNEIDFLEKDFWNYKEEYWRLNIIKGIKEIESKGFYILHIPGSPIIKKVNGMYLVVISKEEVSKSEMNKLEKEVEELEKKIESKREELLELCESEEIEKAVEVWSEIKDLTREYWDKKERYIQIKIMLDTALFII